MFSNKWVHKGYWNRLTFSLKTHPFVLLFTSQCNATLLDTRERVSSQGVGHHKPQSCFSSTTHPRSATAKRFFSQDNNNKITNNHTPEDRSCSFALSSSRWYCRRMLDGTIFGRLLTELLKWLPERQRSMFLKGLQMYASRAMEDGEGFNVDAIFLDSLTPEERKEFLLHSVLRVPTMAHLSALPTLTPSQALGILKRGDVSLMSSEVLVRLATEASKGTLAERAEGIDESISRTGVAHSLLIPNLASSLFLSHHYVDAAALASAARALDAPLEGADHLDLHLVYMKGCVVLGEYSTAIRYAEGDLLKQRQCLLCLLDSNATREACDYLHLMSCPEKVLDNVIAARLIEQLSNRYLQYGDVEFFDVQIHRIIQMLMEAQQQREVDVSVAAALAGCGKWELGLAYFHKCVTLAEMELLLTSAARGGAPFDAIRPYVVEVSKGNPRLTRNGLREIFIRCAAESGASHEAIALFSIAKAEGSSPSLLDHPNLIGMLGCDDVPFSVASLLKAGLYERARERIQTQAEREAWENFVVENNIESELHNISVGSAVRLLVRLCKETHWRKVLEQYFPSVPLAHTTRQWVSHFIAGRLCEVAGVDVAYSFLKSHSSLSDVEALTLLHVVSPSARTIHSLTTLQWRSGLMCFKHPSPLAVPLPSDAVRIVEGWVDEIWPSAKLFARLEMPNPTSQRRGRTKRRGDPHVFHLQLNSQHTAAHPADVPPPPGAEEEKTEASHSPLSLALIDACEKLGNISHTEVLPRWTRLLTQHHMTSRAVGAWLEATASARNIKASVEVLRLALIAQIAPPFDSLMALARATDFTTKEGVAIINHFKNISYHQPLLALVGRTLLEDLASKQKPLSPLLLTLCANDSSATGEEFSHLRGCNVASVSLRVLRAICDERNDSSIRCTVYAFDTKGDGVFVIAGGARKKTFFEGKCAVIKIISEALKQGDPTAWRVVFEALNWISKVKVRCSALDSAVEKALLILSVSDVPPTKLLACLGELTLSPDSVLVRVMLSCYFVNHGMPLEANRQLMFVECPSAASLSPSVSSLLEVATVMAMLPNPTLRSLAWIRLDSVAMRCLLLNGEANCWHAIPLSVSRLLKASRFANCNAFQWLLRPASAVIHVGERSGHTEEAANIVNRFEVLPKIIRAKNKLRLSRVARCARN